MNTKPILITIIALIFILAGGIFFTSYDSNTSQDTVVPGGTTTPGTVVSTSSHVGTDEVTIYNLKPYQIVESPLTITGTARNWYFEASFPVLIFDGNGKQIAAAPAQAQGDWMTTEYVPFKVTLSFTPSTATGTIVFRNDNPSGFPENQKEFRLPVTFSPQGTSVDLYYYNSNLDKDSSGNILCSEKGLVPVKKMISSTQTPLQATLNLLLTTEITPLEKSTGLTTYFPLSGVRINSVALGSSGTLRIDLEDPNQLTSGGACKAQIIKSQIEKTAQQFSNVKKVEFTNNQLFQP